MSHEVIKIQTGSRLHFGPLSHRPERGRHFGGIGMMIANPGISLWARLSERSSSSNSTDVDDVLARLKSNRPEWDQPVHIELESAIPVHQGLGSGTQLGMAVTEAVGYLHGEQSLSARELASYSRRGLRSSVGLHGYRAGGFLVDAGHQRGEAIGQIACHFPFPESWRIVLVTPEEQTGIHGDDEALSFAKLSPMSPNRTGALSHLTLTEILPSLKHTDFAAFAGAIRQYGELVGEFFAAIQGGVFAHSDMVPFVNRLQDHGIRALAQSSWGPTVAVFSSSQEEAEYTTQVIEQDDFGQHCTLRITTPLNNGRTIIST